MGQEHLAQVPRVAPRRARTQRIRAQGRTVLLRGGDQICEARSELIAPGSLSVSKLAPDSKPTNGAPNLQLAERFDRFLLAGIGSLPLLRPSSKDGHLKGPFKRPSLGSCCVVAGERELRHRGSKKAAGARPQRCHTGTASDHFSRF